MNLEDQVCSLELSKRLKELGVKQESYFEWRCERDHFTHEPCKDFFHWSIQKADDNFENSFSAFTVSELGEILPVTIGDQTWLSYTKCLNGWEGICESVSYHRWDRLKNQSYLEIIREEINSYPHTKHEKAQDSMADLFAKSLIHLIEKGIVKP